MKAHFLAVAAVIALFSGVSQASSCGTGSFSSLLGTSCTIGTTTFSFDGTLGTGYFASDPSVLAGLIFTPESTLTSDGFNISGFPGASSTVGEDSIVFFDNFTAVPSSGIITSFTATLNGFSEVKTNASNLISSAALHDSSPIAAPTAVDAYSSDAGPTTHTQKTGGSEPSFGAAGGYFQLDNASESGGSTSFTSADFVFNESPTTAVPEGSELAMIGVSAFGILAGMKKKFRVGSGGAALG